MPADIPDEGGEFAGERDADLVVLKASGLEPAVAVVQASCARQAIARISGGCRS